MREKNRLCQSETVEAPRQKNKAETKSVNGRWGSEDQGKKGAMGDEIQDIKGEGAEVFKQSNTSPNLEQTAGIQDLIYATCALLVLTELQVSHESKSNL